MQRVTTKALAQKLSDLGFKQYSKAFIDNEITGDDIPYLTEDHLIEMGVELIGHRMLILKKLRELYDGKNPTPVNLVSQSSQPNSLSSERPTQTTERMKPAQISQYQPSRDSNDNDTFKRPVKKETPKISRVSTPKHVVQDASDSEYTRPKQETPKLHKPAFEAKKDLEDESSSDDEEDAYSRPMKKAQAKVTMQRRTRDSMTSDSDTEQPKPKRDSSRAIRLNEDSSSSMRSSSTALSVMKQQEKQNRVAAPALLQKTKSEVAIDTSSSAPQTQDVTDKVVCPYCGRKFLPDAARRHIPVCGRIRGMPMKK